MSALVPLDLMPLESCALKTKRGREEEEEDDDGFLVVLHPTGRISICEEPDRPYVYVFWMFFHWFFLLFCRFL